MAKKKLKCICEHPYGMDEAIILNPKCPVHKRRMR